MPVIKSWANWIATPKAWLTWPVRNVFNHRAENAVLEAEAEAYRVDLLSDDNNAPPAMSLEEAKARLTAKRQEWEAHAERGQHPASASMLWKLATLKNQVALDERKKERGAKPTTICIVVNGKLDHVIIAPTTPLSPEESTRRLEVYLNHKQERPDEDAHSLRLVQ